MKFSRLFRHNYTNGDLARVFRSTLLYNDDRQFIGFVSGESFTRLFATIVAHLEFFTPRIYVRVIPEPSSEYSSTKFESHVRFRTMSRMSDTSSSHRPIDCYRYTLSHFICPKDGTNPEQAEMITKALEGMISHSDIYISAKLFSRNVLLVGSHDRIAIASIY